MSKISASIGNAMSNPIFPAGQDQLKALSPVSSFCCGGFVDWFWLWVGSSLWKRRIFPQRLFQDSYFGFIYGIIPCYVVFSWKISLLPIPIIVITQLLCRRDPVFNLDVFYPLQVLDVLCCENKPRYDKEKSSGEDIAIADVVGAPVRYDRFFIGWSFSYFWCWDAEDSCCAIISSSIYSSWFSMFYLVWFNVMCVVP